MGVSVPGIINAINPAQSLKDFYSQFGDTSRGGGNPLYTLSQNSRFGVAFFCNDMFPNPVDSLAVKTMGSALFTSIAGSMVRDGVLGVIKSVGSAYLLTFLNTIINGVELPDFSTNDGDYQTPSDKGITEFGFLNFPGKFMLPETNEFKINFVDTELSPLDSFFFQWLSQTTAPAWAYEDKPYMTANIFISPLTTVPEFGGGESGQTLYPRQVYIAFRCFPSSVSLPGFNINSEPGESQRSVTFKFSKLVVVPSLVGIAQQIYSVVK